MNTKEENNLKSTTNTINNEENTLKTTADNISNEEKIINAINMLRPYINADGGDIEYIKYEDKVVYVRVHGACAACGSIDLTIKEVLYNAIKDEVPEVEEVINVTL